MSSLLGMKNGVWKFQFNLSLHCVVKFVFNKIRFISVSKKICIAGFTVFRKIRGQIFLKNTLPKFSTHSQFKIVDMQISLLFFSYLQNLYFHSWMLWLVDYVSFTWLIFTQFLLYCLVACSKRKTNNILEMYTQTAFIRSTCWTLKVSGYLKSHDVANKNLCTTINQQNTIFHIFL